jgi:hypothetical protein
VVREAMLSANCPKLNLILLVMKRPLLRRVKVKLKDYTTPLFCVHWAKEPKFREDGPM